MMESMLDADKDLGFVDKNDLHQLQTCFDNNQNVTMLTELLTNFLKIQSLHDAGNASVPPRSLEHAKNASVPTWIPVSPLHNTHTHTLSTEDPTKEIVEPVKNLKRPIFKGEDKE